MPTLMLKLNEPQPPQRHAALAGALTRLAAEVLGKRPEVTAVVIEEVAASRWHVGGAPARRPAAWLEISITAGTNTEAEKARFVEAAFEELQRQLAPAAGLEAASYVIVRELPATDWGYGGRTQQARRIANGPAAPAALSAP